MEYSETLDIRDDMIKSHVDPLIAVKYGNHHPEFVRDPAVFIFLYSNLRNETLQILEERGLGVMRIGKRFIHIPVFTEETLVNPHVVQLDILNSIARFASEFGLDVIVETCDDD